MNIKITINATCKVFNISRSHIMEKSRHKHITMPRHIAMYLSRAQGRKSFQTIANSFGRSDHSTAYHAYKAVEKKLAQNDTETVYYINEIKKVIKHEEFKLYQKN